MKTIQAGLIGAAFLLATGVHAGVYSFDVPPVLNNPGLANSYASDGATFAYGVYAPLTDSFGSDIPGTERWQVDAGAGPVTVEKPLDYGRGTTSETELNALFQPVLLLFPPSTFITGLSGKLEGSGLSGNANPTQLIQFFDGQAHLLGSLPVDLSIPNGVFSSGSLAQASMVLLPAGKFYRQITVTTVPEIDARSLVAGVLLAGAIGYRRFRR